MQLYLGDCLEVMKDIPDNSVELVLCDLPYGVTEAKWDEVIPIDKLWELWSRVVIPGGIIALFGVEPFSTHLRNSNIKKFKYDWIWEKSQSGSPLLAKKMPMKVHEIISVFSNNKGTDDPAFHDLRDYLISEYEKSGLTRKTCKELLGNDMGGHYFTKGTQWALPSEENYIKLQSTGYFQRPHEELKSEYEILKNGNDKGFRYYPQMSKGKPYISKGGDAMPLVGNTLTVDTFNEGTRYPRSVIKFSRENTGYHPTQKPVALLEYLIKTYTVEGETVLDNCMGSGSTGVACVNCNRNFIGIEKDENYFKTAEKRIEEAQK